MFSKSDIVSSLRPQDSEIGKSRIDALSEEFKHIVTSPFLKSTAQMYTKNDELAFEILELVNGQFVFVDWMQSPSMLFVIADDLIMLFKEVEAARFDDRQVKIHDSVLAVLFALAFSKTYAPSIELPVKN